MSAYGAIKAPASSGSQLAPTAWFRGSLKPESPSESSTDYVIVHHLTLAIIAEDPSRYAGLTAYLCSVFAGVVEDGMTYPQEDPIHQESFEAYFFAADVFVAQVPAKDTISRLGALTESSEVPGSVLQLEEGKSWAETIVGFYYVKPNYPGRSSHICNAGFIVPSLFRKGGYGHSLARSYLHCAPKLGYQASVFNLVYVNNVASVKLWERLGFTKAGLIPRAGRLKKQDVDGEEYVDAYVFYKSFLP